MHLFYFVRIEPNRSLFFFLYRLILNINSAEFSFYGLSILTTWYQLKLLERRGFISHSYRYSKNFSGLYVPLWETVPISERLFSLIFFRTLSHVAIFSSYALGYSMYDEAAYVKRKYRRSDGPLTGIQATSENEKVIRTN